MLTFADEQTAEVHVPPFLFLRAERSCYGWIESSACRQTPGLLRGEDCVLCSLRACTHLRLLNSTRVKATQHPAMQRDAISNKKTDADNEIEILNFEVCSTRVVCAPTVATRKSSARLIAASMVWTQEVKD